MKKKLRPYEKMQLKNTKPKCSDCQVFTIYCIYIHCQKCDFYIKI